MLTSELIQLLAGKTVSCTFCGTIGLVLTTEAKYPAHYTPIGNPCSMSLQEFPSPNTSTTVLPSVNVQFVPDVLTHGGDWAVLGNQQTTGYSFTIPPQTTDEIQSKERFAWATWLDNQAMYTAENTNNPDLIDLLTGLAMRMRVNDQFAPLGKYGELGHHPDEG
jgi:hypothetical protein